MSSTGAGQSKSKKAENQTENHQEGRDTPIYGECSICCQDQFLFSLNCCKNKNFICLKCYEEITEQETRKTATDEDGAELQVDIYSFSCPYCRDFSIKNYNGWMEDEKGELKYIYTENNENEAHKIIEDFEQERYGLYFECEDHHDILLNLFKKQTKKIFSKIKKLNKMNKPKKEKRQNFKKITYYYTSGEDNEIIKKGRIYKDLLSSKLTQEQKDEAQNFENDNIHNDIYHISTHHRTAPNNLQTEKGSNIDVWRAFVIDASRNKKNHNNTFYYDAHRKALYSYDLLICKMDFHCDTIYIYIDKDGHTATTLTKHLTYALNNKSMTKKIIYY